ncbi:MAG: malto-oligosyltrehalose synthase [Chloroflexota bacterium]
MTERYLPLATYRLQLTPEFGLDEARHTVPYLADLGVDTLYLSPIFEARSGSQHGYDVTDSRRVREELGGYAAFQALAERARGYGMGILLDIVPNHMAASTENPWWRDVLEHGLNSPYADFFDIHWDERSDGRLTLPVLGSRAEEAVTRGELRLALDAEGFCFRYFEHRFPLNPGTFPPALERWMEENGHPGASAGRIRGWSNELRKLPGWRSGGEGLKDRADALKEELLAALVTPAQRSSAPVWESEDARLIHDLLAAQPYALEFWQDGLLHINYRRFFDIADLAGLRVENEPVFREVHDLPLWLARQGDAQGFRIDHVDGLRDPAGYLRRLRRALDDAAPDSGTSCAVYVEKILGSDESLPPGWPVEGTTGYEFSDALNAVFVADDGLQRLLTEHRRHTGSDTTFQELVWQKKLEVTDSLFAPELQRLSRKLHSLLTGSGDHALSTEDCGEAIRRVSAALPVYRTYIDGGGIEPDDLELIDAACAYARRNAGSGVALAMDGFRELLLRRVETGDKAALHFALDWQQFTGPVAAKGVEDTALYNFSVLVSLNEVGGEPSAGEYGPGRLHEHNERAAASHPASMTGTSTHDSKRSEDVRARVNVISEIADEWTAKVGEWRSMTSPGRSVVGGGSAPAPDDELLFYQTLAGAWPLDEAGIPGLEDRLRSYTIKAAREAKSRTSWLAPDGEYEDALARFVGHALGSDEFMGSFKPVQQRIAFHGALNSLSQVALKGMSPGVPDFYQGTEMWDFSLVDPDNRRPVDYDMRSSTMDTVRKLAEFPDASQAEQLMREWRSGAAKLFVTQAVLRLRRASPNVLRGGKYHRLSSSGKKAAHICAFARRSDSGWMAVAVPRLTAGLVTPEDPPIGNPVWGDTRLSLPDDAPKGWRNVLTGESIAAEWGNLDLGGVLQHFPVALLVGEGAGDETSHN